MGTVATLLSAGVVKPKYAEASRVFTIKSDFNLASLAAVLANGDDASLLTLPAKTVVLAATLEVLTAGTKDATTFTLQLRAGTTAIGPALSAVATGIAVSSASEGAFVSASDATINVLAAVSGGNALVTANPKVRVTLFCAAV